jgi:hypothetical protein
VVVGLLGLTEMNLLRAVVVPVVLELALGLL